jgi:outer membrane beta-barrel protein
MKGIRPYTFGIILGLLVYSTLALAADEAAKPAQPAETNKPKEVKAPPAEEKKEVEVREDRIKSIQRRAFLKRNRWELAPNFCVSVNDAFYQKMGIGATGSYHLADGLGLEVQGIYIVNFQTDMVNFFQRANEALPRVSQMRYYFMGSLLWSPLYGKLSFFTDDIVAFDAYLIGGFGMVYTETGAKLASNLGLGLRYFITSWLAIKLEVRDLIYTETLHLDQVHTDYSDIQNQLMVGLGVSFFLPTDFEYEYQ